MANVDDIDLSSLDFGRVLRDTDRGLKVKPILHNYLHDANFPDFSVHFEKGDGRRSPDGWFHPSKHPLLPERWLYYYLTQPDLLIAEPMPYMNTLSVTMGKALHGFFEMCLKDAKYLLPREPGDCDCGDPQCTEWGFVDEEVGERGHTDGMSTDGEIFEFKTITEMARKIKALEDLDEVGFKATWPDYWAQQQSYQRMSGRRTTRVLFFTLGFPWEMREFVINFDPSFSHQVATKYLKVRQAVADGRPPSPCCGGLKTCATRRLCIA